MQNNLNIVMRNFRLQKQFRAFFTQSQALQLFNCLQETERDGNYLHVE